MPCTRDRATGTRPMRDGLSSHGWSRDTARCVLVVRRYERKIRTSNVLVALRGSVEPVKNHQFFPVVRKASTDQSLFTVVTRKSFLSHDKVQSHYPVLEDVSDETNFIRNSQWSIQPKYISFLLRDE